MNQLIFFINSPELDTSPDMHDIPMEASVELIYLSKCAVGKLIGARENNTLILPMEIAHRVIIWLLVSPGDAHRAVLI